MCKFRKAWVGNCKNDKVENTNYCTEHMEQKCSVCGEQATHDCSETNQFVCGVLLCDSNKCKLEHFYYHHGYAFDVIAELEKMYNIKPFNIVVSIISFGSSDDDQILNKINRERLKILIMTFNNNIVTFYDARFGYYFKTREDVDIWIKDYKRSIGERSVFYSNKPIKIKERYNENVLWAFEKLV